VADQPALVADRDRDPLAERLRPPDVVQERRRQRAFEAESEDAGSRLLRRLSGATPVLLALALLFLGTQINDILSQIGAAI